MNKKNGQVTLFIVISVIIVAAVILFFLFRQGNNGLGGSSDSLGVKSLNSYVEECIYSSGEAALFYIGQNGGYYLPDEKTKFSEYGFPYYVRNSEVNMPTKSKIESEISSFVEDSLVECTGNFSEFETSIKQRDEVIVDTEILPKKVELEVEYPLTVEKGDEKKLVDSFESEVPVRLGHIYDFSKGIVSEYTDNTPGVCFNCIDGDYFEKGIKFYTLGGIEEDTIEYRIVDPQSELNDESSNVGTIQYEFGFVVQTEGNETI